MTIKISCPRCFHHYRFKDTSAGMEISCSQCAATFLVPRFAVFDRCVRDLQIRDAVRLALVKARLLTNARLSTRTPARTLPPPHLDLEHLVEIEERLDCHFHDEILALFTGEDVFDDDHDICLGRVGLLTTEAHEAGISKDEVAIGLLPYADTLLCVSRRPYEDSTLTIIEHRRESDQSSSTVALDGWLESFVRWRIEQIAATNPELAARVPTEKELADFRPVLVSRLV
jgi:hypothetical protein